MKLIVFAFAATVIGVGGALANHPTVPISGSEQSKGREFVTSQSGFGANLSARAGARQQPVTEPHDVFTLGEYIGTDPDPRIRSSLLREHSLRTSD